MRQIGIFGAGGHAKEIAWMAEQSFDVVAHIQEGPRTTLNGRPVMPFSEFSALHPQALIVVAVGSPALRKKLAAQCVAAGFGIASVVDQSAQKSTFVRVGTGLVVFCRSVITVDVEIGDHVHINSGCTVSHDSRIGDYSTLSPGVHVCGNVHIGQSVYIGVGASIINGTPAKPLIIGDGSYIAAGACVTKDVEPNCLYAGVPAILKKRY